MKFSLRVLVFFLLLAAVPLCAYFWVFQPVNLQMKAQKETIATNLKKLETCQKAKSVIEELNAELKRNEEAVTFFESKLPAQHEIHKVLEQVTQIAKNHKLETKLFKTLATKPFARYSEQPITMKIFGNFDAYYEFLLDVEKLPRITKIQDMELKDADKSNNGMTEAQFTLSIFYSLDSQQGT